MAKEILFYGSIYSWSVTDFIAAMEEAKSTDVTLRLNSNGGDPEDGWGAVAKFAEHTKKKLIKVDGKARSMGLYFLCYADDVECLDVSTFMLHRAGYSDYLESSDRMTPALWDSLNATNAKLRAAFEAKVDVAKFEALKGVTLDQVFSNEGKLDVEFTAAEALAIGLVNRITKLTPGIKAEINSYVTRMAAEGKGSLMITADTEVKPITKNPNKMTLAEFKAAHPSVFAEAVTEGVNQERDRVGAFMAFVDVDPEAVAKGIKDGTALTQTMTAELGRKAFSKEALKKVTTESAAEVETGAADTTVKTAEQKEVEDFSKKVKAQLKVA